MSERAQYLSDLAAGRDASGSDFAPAKATPARPLPRWGVIAVQEIHVSTHTTPEAADQAIARLESAE